MAATQTILSLEEFRALAEREADSSNLYELSEGELITLPPPGFEHGAIVAAVIAILKQRLNPRDYLVVGGDAGFVLDPNPRAATVRGPDVAVSRRADVGEKMPRGWFQGAPLLAIEVISPSATAKDIQLKVKQYLKAGTAEVWLLYPDTQTIYVYSAGARNPQVFESGDTFTSVVKQQFQVSEFFEI